MGNAPFLYDHPSKYSFAGPTDKAWDPKAVTRASYAAPLPPRPKREGPLIDAMEFNRHPDSYFVVPYGNLDWKPMSPRTRQKVQYTRQGQLFLRVGQLLGALGLLFCVICIKGTKGTEGWIIRVPAGVGILHTIYAVYHLSRSASARTPGSSASYMIFATIIDLGLIPFLVFTAMLARTQYLESSDTPGRWASLFMFDTATTKILNATYLVSVVNGSLHFVSLIISVYLTVIFRQISRLPPDMNPLEDNLTSRHKRNKSELLDSRTSQASTAITSKRDSRANEPLISPVRSVPFMHSRNDSSIDLNSVPRPHFSPQNSRINVSTPFYDQPLSNRTSRANIQQQSFYSQPVSQQTSRTTIKEHSKPSPLDQYLDQVQATPDEPTLLRSPTKSSSIYTDDLASRATSTRPPSTRPPTTRPLSTAPSLPPTSERNENDDNWITHPSPPPSPPAEFKHLRNSNPYRPLPHSISPYEGIENFAPKLPMVNRTPKPLEMNPPTPVNAGFRNGARGTGRPVTHGGDVRGATTIDQRAPLMPGTGNTLGLGQNQRMSAGPLDFNPPKRKSVLDYEEVGRGGIANGAYGRRDGQGRVISRSGVDYAGAIQGNQGVGRGIRAREVSGKMAEEGRTRRNSGSGAWIGGVAR
ncbi:MAG: hypothetical protein Q9194_002720 [Teloschistes cf. exilis]